MSYRIEKQRTAVELVLRGGAVVCGHIFLQPVAFSHGGHELPADVFNSTDPFVPVELGDGTVSLIAKRHVVAVSGIPDGDEDDLRRASARAAALELTMATGSIHAGSVLVEMPSNRARLLDFLNQMSDRFLTICASDGVWLLNTRMIERVRPLD